MQKTHTHTHKKKHKKLTGKSKRNQSLIFHWFSLVFAHVHNLWPKSMWHTVFIVLLSQIKKCHYFIWKS